MFDQYRAKLKKKIVDPNAPPRPTLLGHEKELKSYRQQLSGQDDLIRAQSLAIKALERKVIILQSRLDALSSLQNRKS
ncbi:MAG: hypothetical protein RLZZ196_1770 [Bacteroidota bacterium]|jgi:hypothetical protein